MSIGWILVVILLVIGVIVGNILLLKDSAKFKLPKDFKKRPDSEYDGDDDDNRGF
ncbi:DUF2897 family protein [Glaciecola sp. 1036]|uniref:DUF2897 family protein n=1 Tax=Alteromonadaceae TaxID=72275 RepID=UPI003D01701A